MAFISVVHATRVLHCRRWMSACPDFTLQMTMRSITFPLVRFRPILCVDTFSVGSVGGSLRFDRFCILYFRRRKAAGCLTKGRVLISVSTVPLLSARRYICGFLRFSAVVERLVVDRISGEVEVVCRRKVNPPTTRPNLVLGVDGVNLSRAGKRQLAVRDAPGRGGAGGLAVVVFQYSRVAWYRWWSFISLGLVVRPAWRVVGGDTGPPPPEV